MESEIKAGACQDRNAGEGRLPIRDSGPQHMVMHIVTYTAPGGGICMTSMNVTQKLSSIAATSTVNIPNIRLKNPSVLFICANVNSLISLESCKVGPETFFM